MNNDEVLNLKFKICDYIKYEVDKNRRVTVLESKIIKYRSFLEG